MLERVRRKPHLWAMIWIGLGSNEGNRAIHMQKALEKMSEMGVNLTGVSSLYETAPWGIEEQRSFFNAVVQVDTSLDSVGLLRLLLGTEDRLGRVRRQKWGPRIIDLDLLEYHGQQWETPSLTLPHPLYMERSFVLAPMAELAPDYVPTGKSKTVKQLLEELPGDLPSKVWNSDWWKHPLPIS